MELDPELAGSMRCVPTAGEGLDFTALLAPLRLVRGAAFLTVIGECSELDDRESHKTYVSCEKRKLSSVQ